MQGDLSNQISIVTQIDFVNHGNYQYFLFSEADYIKLHNLTQFCIYIF